MFFTDAVIIKIHLLEKKSDAVTLEYVRKSCLTYFIMIRVLGNPGYLFMLQFSRYDSVMNVRVVLNYFSNRSGFVYIFLKNKR